MKIGDIVVYNGKIGKVIKDVNGFRFKPMGYGRYYISDLDTIFDNSVREATNEEKIRLIKEEFVWGYIINIHCIGEYQIIEYESKTAPKHLWNTYINYADTNNSYTSLDSALIGCIGRKYEGANGKAAMYFEKMIGLEQIYQKIGDKLHENCEC